MADSPRKPLSREQVIRVLARENSQDIPVVFHTWWGQGLDDKYGTALAALESDFPADIFTSFYLDPGDEVSATDNPQYRWGYRDDYPNASHRGIGHQIELLTDWDDLDLLLADFPDPAEPGVFEQTVIESGMADGRFRLGCWWRFLHERFWAIRGMENLMLDYHDNMGKLKILGRKIVDFHKGIADRFADLGFDGIFVSDDLGHQTGPMMSPDTFEELYFPLYREFAAHLHSKGMYFFLHTCGDNTLLMDYLIQAGVDVIHPIQKGCMDWDAVADTYGSRITFMAGMDVQHILPAGSPAEVRDEVRHMIRTFHRPDGGMILSAGNGILPDTPLANIRAMLEQMHIGAAGF